MFKNKNEEEEEEEDPNASYNRKFYGDANKYDEDYYNNYIKQYQAAQNMRCHKTNMNSNLFVLNSFVRPGSGPSGAEVEEVETCMEEVTEDTTSSVSVEEEVEEEEIDTEGNVDTCIGCRAEEVEKEVLEECWPDLFLCHSKVSAWVRGEGEPSQCAYPWWGRGNILIRKLLV